MLTYSQFMEKVRTGQIASVVVMGSNAGAIQALCRRKDGGSEQTVLPADYRDALLAMQEKLVNVEIQDSPSGWRQLLINATPFLLLLAVWIFLMIRNLPDGHLIFP
jgi:ATP-dependent Zn protease